MKKIINIIFLFLITLSSFSLSMDITKQKSKLIKKECQNSLETYIIEHTFDKISFDHHDILNVQDVEYIRSKNRSVSNKFFSCQYINYLDKIASFNNNSLVIFCGKEKIAFTFPNISEDNMGIKALSFNKDASKIAIVDSRHLYIWNLEKNSIPFSIYSFQNENEKKEYDSFVYNTCTGVALNDIGNKVAINIQSTKVYQDRSYTYHNLTIIDVLKKSIQYKFYLNTFYPEELYFLDDNRLVYKPKQDDRKILYLNRGKDIINNLNERQKKLLDWVYEQWKMIQNVAINNGLCLMVPRVQFSKNDEHYKVFGDLPLILKQWVYERAEVEGYNTNEDCTIN